MKRAHCSKCGARFKWSRERIDRMKTKVGGAMIQTCPNPQCRQPYRVPDEIRRAWQEQ